MRSDVAGRDVTRWGSWMKEFALVQLGVLDIIVSGAEMSGSYNYRDVLSYSLLSIARL